MPISNIIDRRTNYYNYNVSVIFEESWHDVDGGTKFQIFEVNTLGGIDYIGIHEITIELAIKYKNQQWDRPVTLYLYDIEINNPQTCYENIICDNNKLILTKLK